MFSVHSVRATKAHKRDFTFHLLTILLPCYLKAVAVLFMKGKVNHIGNVVSLFELACVV